MINSPRTLDEAVRAVLSAAREPRHRLKCSSLLSIVVLEALVVFSTRLLSFFSLFIEHGSPRSRRLKLALGCVRLLSPPQGRLDL